MAENIIIPQNAEKEDLYKSILPQISALTNNEPDLIANMANISAVLKMAFDFLWVGFYLVKDNELVLGPFQGTVACTRIACGKGVCGTAWKERHTIIVPDVDKFAGHIACSSLSKSEIVVPIFVNNDIIGVLDIDSQHLNTFDLVDAHYLEQMLKCL
ncbi:MAG: GAF domain-containing protein [Prevotellaceae bacterium]|jgi:GAF domain-containing protein|nr:GAF domain-containing protein [Prevotellaceae bacterium]